MWAAIFVTGAIFGYLMPHARIYGRVCDHFIKSMTKRNERIHQLWLENTRLKKQLKKYQIVIKRKQNGNIKTICP